MPPSMARRNILAAVLLLALGTGYGIMTASLPDRHMPNTPGPAFLPWLITGALIALSAMLFFGGLIAGGKESEERRPPTGIGDKGGLALIGFAAYLAALPYLGFLPASVPFFAFLMLLYGAGNKPVLLLAAVVVPVAIFCLFHYGFHIPLPRGVWK